MVEGATSIIYIYEVSKYVKPTPVLTSLETD